MGSTAIKRNQNAQLIIKYEKNEINTPNSNSNYPLSKISEYEMLENSKATTTKQSMTQTQKDESNSDMVTQEKTEIEPPKFYLIKLVWSEGGKEVKIKGDFCSWAKDYKMIERKNNNNYSVHEIRLSLPKGKHQFKFIVDGKWMCSSNYQITKDKDNNYNNYIEFYDTQKINEINNIPYKQNISIVKGNLEDLKKRYTNLFPDRCQLNEEAPKIPEVFSSLFDFDISSNNKGVGENKFLKLPKKYFNDSYKKLRQIPISYINHLFTNKNIISNDNSTKMETYTAVDISVKVENKNLKILYFTPIYHT